MDTVRQFSEAWMPIFGIHMLEISAFILLVWIVDRFVRLDTRLRYLLWLLALVKVFVPPVFSLPMLTLEPNALPAQISFQAIGVNLSGSQFSHEAKRFSLSWFVLITWMASVLTLAGMAVFQNVALRRRLRNGIPVEIPTSYLPTHSSQTGLQIFTVCTIQSPVLVGHLRPRLYLPEEWKTWPHLQLRGVLSHEIAHLRFSDRWVIVLQALAHILFGLNPLVWLLCSRLAYIRELRCDETAIEELNIDPVDYSKLLYAFIQKQVHGTFPVTTGISFLDNHRAILKRFHHLLNFQKATRSRKSWHPFTLVILALFIFPFSVKGREENLKSQDDLPKRGEFVPVDTQPMPISKPAVKYPESALRDSIEGVVFIHVLVGKDGKTRQVEVIRGPAIFHEASIASAEAMVWEPATHKGDPISVWIAYQIRFKFRSDGSPSAMGSERPSNFLNRGPAIMVETESGDSIHVDKIDKMPSPIGSPKPVYPESAIKDSLNGLVVIQLLVGKDGRVKKTRLLEGEEPFSSAAIEAGKKSIWEPAIYKGKPVGVWVAFPIRFIMSQSKQRGVIPPNGD